MYSSDWAPKPIMNCSYTGRFVLENGEKPLIEEDERGVGIMMGPELAFQKEHIPLADLKMWSASIN